MQNIFTSSTRGAQIFQAVALVSTIGAFAFYGISAEAVLLILLGYFVYGCLGIVVTFHRYHTHNSYQARPWLANIFSVAGCLAGTGSPLAWVAIHINHHRKSDKPGDPHSPLHKGMKIFLLDYVEEVDTNTKWKMRRLVTNKFQQFLHRYYFLILVSWSILLLVVGGPWLMLFGHLVPATLTGLMSNIVNYVGHMPNWWGGFRTYNLNDASANNWLWSIPSWGESWHNNHHRFPRRSYFGDKWYQIDISGTIIKLIKA